MNIGDIVLYQDKRWKVSLQLRDFRTFNLVAFDGDKVEVPDDLPETDLKVLFNPAESWPFIVAPVRIRSGPLTLVKRGEIGLTPLVDWVPSEFLRPGGPVFFNPNLRLRSGEVLVGIHRNGDRSRLAVTTGFGTVRKRKHRAKNPVEIKGPRDSLDRLMADDLFDDDK